MLPKIVAGSSAGSIVSSFLCCLSDKELIQIDEEAYMKF